MANRRWSTVMMVTMFVVLVPMYEAIPSKATEPQRPRLVVELLTEAVSQEARDPADAGGRLDVLRLRQGMGEKSGRIWHSLKMARMWRGKLLVEKDPAWKSNYIDMYLSTDDETEYAEWRIVIRHDNGKLKAFVQRYEEDGDFTSFGEPKRIGLRRPNRKTVRVSFLPDEIGNPDRYAWLAVTRFRSGYCDPHCTDFAPEGEGTGRFEHDVSGKNGTENQDLFEKQGR